MRTMLAESRPPRRVEEETVIGEIAAIANASPKPAKDQRTFSESAVLATGDDFLMEVGVDGKVMATPGASRAEQAVPALERGVAAGSQKPDCSADEACPSIASDLGDPQTNAARRHESP